MPNKFSRDQKPWDKLSIRKLQYMDCGNPTLTILNLMAITSICAVTISLITAVGFFGVHVLLGICLFANIYMARRMLDRPVLFRFWNQFTWGVLMPIVCVFGDPFVFGYFELGKIVYINDNGIGCYAFMVWQIFVLGLSWLVREEQDWQNEFVAGTLLAGGIFAVVVGLCILPLTLFATLMLGLGIPGFTPWFTASVYLRTAKMHFGRVSIEGRQYRLISIGAFLFAVAIGIIALTLSVQWELGFGTANFL